MIEFVVVTAALAAVIIALILGHERHLERNWRIHRRLHFPGWTNEEACWWSHHNGGWNGKI